MIRPIPLILFGVIAVAQQILPQETHSGNVGILLWLCVIPALSIIAAAVALSDVRQKRRESIQTFVPAVASLVILASWSIAIFAMSWMQFVRSHIGDIVVVDEVVILLPAVIALSILWFVTGPKGARVSWLSHRIRLDFLIMSVPILFLWSIRETAEHLGYVEHLMAVEIAGVLLVVLFSPFLIATILPARAIRDQEIRQSVFDISARAGVRLRNVLKWNTRNRVMNAMAIGFVPWGRMIILSDKLIKNVTRAELHAVTAHEIGHHRYRHALFLGLTVFGVLFWVDWFSIQLFTFSDSLVLLIAQLTIAVVALVMVSRKFECQADAYAAVDFSKAQGSNVITANAAAAMSNVLSTIAWTYNISTQRNDPMHGSIASRQKNLARLVGLPITSLSIDRLVRWLKVAILLLFVSGVLL